MSSHGRVGHEDWSSKVQVILARDCQLVTPSRGALVQYVLQRYPIDPNIV